MTEAWSKLPVPRARLSPSGPVSVAGPRTGPPTGEQFAALAVLAAIAAQQDAAATAKQDAAADTQQDAARQATSVSTRPQHRPQHAAVGQQDGGDQLAASQQSSGDQLAAPLAEIEVAQRKGSRPY